MIYGWFVWRTVYYQNGYLTEHIRNFINFWPPKCRLYCSQRKDFSTTSFRKTLFWTPWCNILNSVAVHTLCISCSAVVHFFCENDITNITRQDHTNNVLVHFLIFYDFPCVSVALSPIGPNWQNSSLNLVKNLSETYMHTVIFKNKKRDTQTKWRWEQSDLIWRGQVLNRPDPKCGWPEETLERAHPSSSMVIYQLTSSCVQKEQQYKNNNTVRGNVSLQRLIPKLISFYASKYN